MQLSYWIVSCSLFIFFFYIFRLVALLAQIYAHRAYSNSECGHGADVSTLLNDDGSVDREENVSSEGSASQVRARLRKLQEVDHSSSATSTTDHCSASSPTIHPVRTMAILGSGGHTAELLSVLSTVDRRLLIPLVFVSAETDRSSEQRARRGEEERKNLENCKFLTIPRSREVGQSYLTSIWTTLYATFHGVWIVYKHRPQLLLCTGPGTCVPLCWAAFAFKLFLFRPCSIIFTESFCRVQTLSLSGLLLYPLADEFIVQWPQLARSESTSTTSSHGDPAGDESTHSEKPIQPTASSLQKGWRLARYIGRLC